MLMTAKHAEELASRHLEGMGDRLTPLELATVSDALRFPTKSPGRVAPLVLHCAASLLRHAHADISLLGFLLLLTDMMRQMDERIPILASPLPVRALFHHATCLAAPHGRLACDALAQLALQRPNLVSLVAVSYVDLAHRLLVTRTVAPLLCVLRAFHTALLIPSIATMHVSHAALAAVLASNDFSLLTALITGEDPELVHLGWLLVAAVCRTDPARQVPVLLRGPILDHLRDHLRKNSGGDGAQLELLCVLSQVSANRHLLHGGAQ
eukprot:scaffold105000_cov31-Tisochrysis_lutea.AAC.1